MCQIRHALIHSIRAKQVIQPRTLHQLGGNPQALPTRTGGFLQRGVFCLGHQQTFIHAAWVGQRRRHGMCAKQPAFTRSRCWRALPARATMAGGAGTACGTRGFTGILHGQTVPG